MGADSGLPSPHDAYVPPADRSSPSYPAPYHHHAHHDAAAASDDGGGGTFRLLQRNSTILRSMYTRSLSPLGMCRSSGKSRRS